MTMATAQSAGSLEARGEGKEKKEKEQIKEKGGKEGLKDGVKKCTRSVVPSFLRVPHHEKTAE